MPKLESEGKVFIYRPSRLILAKDAGISVVTANSWISILEASFVLLRLPPYYKNFSKRVIKSSKIYFCDTGLLCNLLNIFNREQLQESNLRGAIFENLIVIEYRVRFHLPDDVPRFE